MSFGLRVELKTVCRMLAIAALLQGWLLCVGFCVPCKCASMCGGLSGFSHRMFCHLNMNGMLWQGCVQ